MIYLVGSNSLVQESASGAMPGSHQVSSMNRVLNFEAGLGGYDVIKVGTT